MLTPFTARRQAALVELVLGVHIIYVGWPSVAWCGVGVGALVIAAWFWTHPCGKPLIPRPHWYPWNKE